MSILARTCFSQPVRRLACSRRDTTIARGDTPLNVPENWFKPLTVEIIQEQLDAGVDINELNLSGSSVIVRAGNSMAGEEVWQFLIDKGARLTEKQLEGREAIFWVTKGGTPEAVRRVLDRARR